MVLHDDIELDGQQIDLIEDLDQAWADFVLRSTNIEEFVGGLAFKTVSGHDYLVRYRNDPETGKKVFTSLGRRSPQTERELATWTSARANNKERLATTKAKLERLGRMGKALGLARVPVKLGEILEAFREANLTTKELRLAGPAALFGYEIKARDLAARDRFAELGSTVHFVSRELSPTVLRDIRKALAPLDPIENEISAGRMRIRLASGARVDVLDGSVLRVDDDLEHVQAVCLNRSGRPVEAIALHPEAWLDLDDRLDDKWEGARDFVERRLDRIADPQPEDAAPALRSF